MSEIKLPHNHNEKVEPIYNNMPKAGDLQIVSDILKQLCDPSRLRIFWILCHCEECVTNISAITEMSSPAVSHHLRQLKASGLIVSKRSGKEVYYKAADTEQTRLLHPMLERLMEISCPSE